MLVFSVSVCAPAHGRERSARAGAGCQCPCHSVWWWLGIEGLHFSPLSATMCRHGGGGRRLQSSPHHSVLHHVYPHPRGKRSACCPLPALSSHRPQQWQEMPHLRKWAPVGWLVRQVLMPKSCKEIQGGRAEVACVLMCL